MATAHQDENDAKSSLLQTQKKRSVSVYAPGDADDGMYHILSAEARRCAVMLVAFAVSLAHLHIYSEFLGVDTVDPDDVPLRERLYFHHGWTAMLVIAFIEAITAFLKVWSTRKSKLLTSVILHKLEGNLGVLFGEYIVVAATYVIMGYN